MIKLHQIKKVFETKDEEQKDFNFCPFCGVKFEKEEENVWKIY